MVIVRPTEEWLNQPDGLAERLMLLRKSAGLTGDRLAAQLGWARSKVPKLENGRQMPSEADVTAWARACGQPDAAGQLLSMLADGHAVHRQFRDQVRRGGHAAVQGDLDKLVRKARRIRNVEVVFIPGLLQTPDYARYRLREAMRASGDDERQLEATVMARMRRQEALYDGGHEFEFIIMETALLMRTCPAQVMIGQLDRLGVISGLGGVTLGIVPIDAELAVTPTTGFLIADDVAYIETATSEDLIFGPEAAAYAPVADDLAGQGLAAAPGPQVTRPLRGLEPQQHRSIWDAVREQRSQQRREIAGRE
jgi:transcriptional regulator with XRE-family HTH domain